MQPSFVHLRLHSEYSISDGIVRLDEAVAAAAADGMPALALTDLANVFGMVKFYKEARAKGIKPIVGCDAWIANEGDRDKPGRLLLLCQSRAGYLRLCEFLSQAYRTNQYRGRAEIDKRWFAEIGTEVEARNPSRNSAYLTASRASRQPRALSLKVRFFSLMANFTRGE